MKIAEPKTPPRCLADASAAAASPAVASTPAAAPHTAAAHADPCGKTELGFTLQTLIVMAVFTLAAVGVGLGLLAVNSASSSSFEEAGQTGVEARCAPNEIWDPELESRGIGGPDSQGGIRSKQVGCEPYCGTWEYLSTGTNENGEYEPAESPASARQSSIGGPEGNGGVYSQNIGCFAPCYWEISYPTGVWRPAPGNVKGTTSLLRYFDDNRAPVADQLRLGVNYRRSADMSVPIGDNPGNLQKNNDLQLQHAVRNKDGKPYILTRRDNLRRFGSRYVTGTLPLTPEQLALGLPTVFTPNWRSMGDDPGGTARNGTTWEDENWEIRADPYEKECTIVNINPSPGYPELVCSSEWDNCEPRP